ncbi:MAG: hypothetical protein PHP93_08150, partial [Kiritimatiellales bacterium]|nr:hypothetical protein [Kiritimatiellales bacterium]
MTEKQRNDATESIKGTIYQLCVAVQKCYEMLRGQVVLIESQGDVSIGGQEQVETKQYSGMLTDNHPNFWNTLANWMQTKFTDEKYSALILYTTQEFGKSSGLATWNADSLLQRISFLEKVLQESEARFAVA